MLVLSRHVGQSVTVGSAVVHVLRASSRRVSLGVDAPQRVRVLRSEIVRDSGGLDRIVDAAVLLAESVLYGGMPPAAPAALAAEVLRLAQQAAPAPGGRSGAMGGGSDGVQP